MSIPTNTDLTEEDAADLQFPKEIIKSSSTVSSTLLLNNKCGICENDLSDRYILCAQCYETICVYCFANGAEIRNHKNDHNYQVIHHDFNLFEHSDWTAKEELTLLNGLLTCGNWQLIKKQLPNRSIDELQNHYDYFYLQRAGSKDFPVIEPPDEVAFCKPFMPYRFKLTDLTEPIRGEDHMYAGYSAARSDFEHDYDKNAEELIAKLQTVHADDPYYNILSSLQIGILNIYRRRLGERQRRKEILRAHGLIMPAKTKSWIQRYYLTLSPMVCDKLIRYMQFYTGEGFVYFLEGLHRAGELKIKISRLLEHRRRGIRTLDEVKLYQKLKNHRQACRRELIRFQQASESSFKYKLPLPMNLGAKKRGMNPLDIIGLPGYEKLTFNERDLCRSIRLSPLTYLDLKNILIQENNKLGYLRLLTARRLLKIDVNKTRKIYDFLISEGHIVPKAND